MRTLSIAVLIAALLAGWVPTPAPAAPARAAAAGEPGEGEAEFEGLPEGPGREAVYFSCTACHSVQQFRQQRMSRAEWDQLLEWMVETNGMHPLKPWARTRVLNYLATHFGGKEEEEEWAGLPPGEGREVVFYACQACHSLKLVTQQGLSREWWDETLTWMVEEQGMPELDAEDRALTLDYLTTNFGPTRRR